MHLPVCRVVPGLDMECVQHLSIQSHTHSGKRILQRACCATRKRKPLPHPMRFERTRGNPTALAGRRLNHSATGAQRSASSSLLLGWDMPARLLKTTYHAKQHVIRHRTATTRQRTRTPVCEPRPGSTCQPNQNLGAQGLQGAQGLLSKRAAVFLEDGVLKIDRLPPLICPKDEDF